MNDPTYNNSREGRFFHIFPGDRVGEGAILARKLVNDDYFYAIEAIN